MPVKKILVHKIVLTSTPVFLLLRTRITSAGNVVWLGYICAHQSLAANAAFAKISRGIGEAAVPRTDDIVIALR